MDFVRRDGHLLIYRRIKTMNAAKKVMKTLKENYMEYVALRYGPFDR
jgi:hypothetical protein